MEIWKPVPGYAGFYAVSSLGRVKNLARYVRSQWDTPRFVGERVLRCAKARYTLVTLSVNGVSKSHTVHRLVCEAFNGPPFEGAHAAHRDGDAHNNVPDNIYWATPTQNCADRTRHGTWAHGTRVNTNKLSEDDVRRIKAACWSGETRKDVAQTYGVHRSTIDQLMRGDTWMHVEVACAK